MWGGWGLSQKQGRGRSEHLRGQSWGFAGGCDGGNQGQKAEGVGKGETLKSFDKEGGEDTGECDDDGKVRR